MEIFSALLAICAGNSTVNGEFPAQRPVTRSFDVFFDLRLNKRLSKQWWGWWFETPSRPLWCHCNFDIYNRAQWGYDSRIWRNVPFTVSDRSQCSRHGMDYRQFFFCTKYTGKWLYGDGNLCISSYFSVTYICIYVCLHHMYRSLFRFASILTFLSAISTDTKHLLQDRAETGIFCKN